MKISVYTSCSINYLPKARALADSLKTHHPDAVIILCLNDVIPSWLDLKQEPFDHIWQPADLGFSDAWTFTHNVMEICTAVKGRALCRMLEEIEADLYLYMDPDVFVYADLTPISDYMGDAEIGLVPHITKPEETELGVEMTEMSVVAHGTYNLGHLVIRNAPAGRAFAKWWDERLTKYCYDDKEYGLFTDQRWCDLAPALFDNVRILREPNMDVASWNVFGRVVEHGKADDSSPFIVDGYPLLTYHFSGTGPSGTHRRVREIFAPSSGAVAEIERDYEEAIRQRGQEKLEKFPYGGDFYENGVKVTPASRHLFRKNADLQEAFPRPFEVRGHSYYHWLSEYMPSHLPIVTLSENQVNRAFIEIFDPIFYLWKYPDVERAIARGEYKDAIDHYIRIGSILLYDPNPLFVSSYYYEEAHKLNGGPVRKFAAPVRENTLLWHYLTVGVSSGVEPIEHFKSGEYLQMYDDICLQFKLNNLSSPFSHFVMAGDIEGRRPSNVLNLSNYIETSPHARKLMSDHNLGPYAAFALLGNVKGRVSLVQYRS
ncbi:hypothetical protein F4U94_22950 [Sphingobium limneticum]|uniref:hypothetical protein n=1 Tax=Sphingobium limneticum TaxID=1007511 RepID=UPI00123D1EC8|nr:hypothetical protein [Sphingobium limneticum]KAA9009627.1 hypothetical protein F4U94_22950 [Sphingobium limneticum]